MFRCEIAGKSTEIEPGRKWILERELFPAGLPANENGCLRSRSYQAVQRREIRTSSMKRWSIPVERKVSMASVGVFTIGWPFTLKLVFNTISLPVAAPTARNKRWNSALPASETV